MKKRLGSKKVLLVLTAILLICFGLIGYVLFKYFYAGQNTNKYGDRLEDIKSHELANDLESKIKSLYDGEIDKVSVKTSGKIVYLTLNLSEVKTKADAKSLALKALDGFEDADKSFYDIQFIITCSKEDEASTENILYPTMGYKNSTSSVVVWIED